MYILYFLLIILNPFSSLYFSLFLKKNNFIGLSLILTALMILLSKTNINVDGDDIFHYINTFNHLDSWDTVSQTSLMYSTSIDLLFWYPSWFISLLTDDPNIFLLFWYSFSLSILYFAYNRILKKESIIIFVIFLSTTTFYFIYGNTIRQAPAVSLSVLALAHYVTNNYRKAYFISVLAIFVHPVAIIVPIGLLISNIKIYYLYVLLLISLVLSTLPTLSILGNIFSFFGDIHIAKKVMLYSEASDSLSIISLGTFIFIFNLLLYLFVKYKLKKEILFPALINMYLYYQIIYFSFLSTGLMSMRIFSYRSVLDPVIMIILINSFKQKLFLRYLLVIFFIMLNIINITKGMNIFLYANEFNLLTLNSLNLFQLQDLKLEN